MFGFRKSAIQVKGAEKFFEKENRRRERARKKAARRGTGGSKRLVIPLVAIVVIVALGMLMRNQQTQILRLRVVKEGEIRALQSRVSALSAELEEIGKQAQAQKESISGLERQLDAEQSRRVRAEAALRGLSLAREKP